MSGRDVDVALRMLVVVIVVVIVPVVVIMIVVVIMVVRMRRFMHSTAAIVVSRWVDSIDPLSRRQFDRLDVGQIYYDRITRHGRLASHNYTF